ncbi:hypothetical protein Q0Z83_104830 [Actinoplanes sichuanensis]|uniref:Uncharacterized protein n=1 Tax=Actinoplanes sichuanensis TaxID=512349 RepID=A0ABW4AJE4_9ACTN|nr:hypothetical protein [Actinoplanes sichuanensis]BEL12292.1 hypothetical protein Q0Z83_104830 [Actinoplanes sichuanensis]
MLADALRTPPDGLGEAFTLIDGLDDALVHGLARLDEERAAALESFAAAFTGSPLSGRVTDAIGKIVAGSVTDEHLAVLAGARAALTGAAHDALLGRLDSALGRSRPAWPTTSTDAGPLPADDRPGPVLTEDASDPLPADGRSGSLPVDGRSGSLPADGRSRPLLAGGRSWLRELALAGWRGVDHELAGGGDRAVQALLADPSGRRLAVLLDGFAAELRSAAPVATFDRIPVRRWADLWARAILLSQDTFAAVGVSPSASAASAASTTSAGSAASAVSATGVVSAAAAVAADGRLLLLGVDLHEHPTVFRAQAHGLLETAGGEVRLVRVSVAAAKVDTISGSSAWRMLSGFPVFREALAGRRTVEVSGMALTPAGDLLWDESRAVPGEPADPFAVARVRLGAATASPVAPLDRHPAAIAEPVLLEGYTAGAESFELGGVTLAVDSDRLPEAGPITPALVAASTACLGLLRWDAGRWAVQPLAVQALVRKKPVVAHTGDWALGPTEPKAAKAEAVAGTAVDVLRERAGRLLRK